jgi:hypothetical protein
MVSLDETLRFLYQVHEAQLVMGDTYTVTCNVKSPCVARSDVWWTEKWALIVEETDKALAARNFRVPKTAPIRSLMLMQVRRAYQVVASSGSLVFTFTNGCCARADCPGTVYERELLATVRRLVKEEEEEKAWPRDL